MRRQKKSFIKSHDTFGMYLYNLIFDFSSSYTGLVSTSKTLKLNKFNLTNDDLPKNTYREYISLSEVNIKDADIYRTVNFTSNVSEPIKKRVSYSYYYSYYETVGYKPNLKSFIESIRFRIDLSNRGTDKQEKLAKAFKQLLEANGYVMDEESKENKFVLVSQGDDCKVVIDYDEDSEVALSFSF